MQQLYLTGPDASALASRLFHAINVRPAGYRLLPFCVGDARRGLALHLLFPCAHNDVPVRVLAAPSQWVTVPQVLEMTAAPALRSAQGIRAPLLLDGLTADMLDAAAFRDAIRQCLLGDAAVVVCADEAARPALCALTPAETQLWLAVPQDADDQAALLETLITEASLRIS